jgi:WD40 repeat protein/tetratricopeptide (TPR) repeat protein
MVQVRTLDQHRDQINSLAYRPRGDQLVSASDDKTAIVWNVETGEVVSTFAGHADKIECVNWHPNGQQIVSTSRDDNSIRFWDPATASEVAAAIEDRVTSYAVWRADGKYLATVEPGWPRGRFVIRDGNTHEPIEIRTAATVGRALWSKNGQSLATSHPWGGPPMIEMWDEQAKRPTRAFTGHTFGVGPMIWIDEDRVATCSADHTIRIWNFKPRELHTVRQEDALESVRWSPDGRLLASLSAAERSVRILSSQNGDVACEISSGDTIGAIAWAPDSRRLATWSFHEVSIWDTQTGRRLMKFDTDVAEPHWAGHRSLEWNPNGNSLLTAVFAKLMIWDTATGQKTHDVAGLAGLVTWSPDGKHIAACGPGMKYTTVLELSSTQEPRQRELPFGALLAWSPDGSQFATAEDSGRIRDTKTGQECLRFAGYSRSDPVTAICWHPDGTRVATGSGLGTVRVWDARTGRELLTLREHAEPINSIEFSRDGTRLVSSGDDGKINVWDATSGYVRFGSDRLLDSLHELGDSGALDADGWQLCGRLHAADGDWDRSAEDFRRAAELLGPESPQWFDAGQWVMGPYPANLQQAYPPEEQDVFDLRQSLPGVAGGSEIPEARELRWQLAEPSFDQGVNLSMHVGTSELICAYALTRVYAPREAKITALIGAARFDEHRLWHNGKLIYEDLQNSVEGRWPDEGSIAVTLTPGWNTFLVKVVNIPFREKPFFLYFRLSEDPTFLARASVRMKDSSEALAALNQFLAANPDNPHLLFARAIAHLRLGNSADAAPDLRQATDELGDILITRLFREAELDEPVEIAMKAIALAPENVELKTFLADGLCHQERWKEALDVERELAKFDQFANHAENLALLLAVCGEEEEYRQQRQILLKRIQAGEDDGEFGAAKKQQITACLVMPMTPRELAQITEAYKWYPVLPVSALADPRERARKLVEGLLEYRRTNYAKAVELLSDAAEPEPTLPEPWMVESSRRRAAASSAYLALALHHVGRVSDAKTMLQQARDLHERRDRNQVGEIYTQIALQEAEQVLQP